MDTMGIMTIIMITTTMGMDMVTTTMGEDNLFYFQPGCFINNNSFENSVNFFQLTEGIIDQKFPTFQCTDLALQNVLFNWYGK